LYVDVTGKAYDKIICLSLAKQDVMTFSLVTLSDSFTKGYEINF
jgi:hypothetical protein